MALFNKRKNSGGKAKVPDGRHFGASSAPSEVKDSGEEVKPQVSQEEQRRKDIAAIKLLALRISLFAGILYILFVFMFNVVPVPDMSMKPKLVAGDLALVYRFDRDFQAGNPVAYRKDSRVRFGRIIAKPGDSIEVFDGGIKINGSSVAEIDVYYKTQPFGDKIKYPIKLGHDQYFIMGDMREGARDSRYFGPVNKDEIIGKVSIMIRRSEI